MLPFFMLCSATVLPYHDFVAHVKLWQPFLKSTKIINHVMLGFGCLGFFLWKEDLILNLKPY